jgi:subtilisin family serine protease
MRDPMRRKMFPLAVVTFFLAGAAFAQVAAPPQATPPWRTKPVLAPAGSEAGRARPASGRKVVHVDTRAVAGPRSPFIDVIVEFREPAGTRTVTTAGAYMRAERFSARGAAVRARVADLQRDLERLDSASRSARTSSTDAVEHESPRIGRTFSRVLFGASARVDGGLLPSIRALPYVASVHVARPFRTMLARSVPHIRANEVWSAGGTRGKNVRVGVIDTGVDYRHPALGGGFGAGFKVAGGWDFANDDADPADDNGHGTHVAGIIAADGGGLIGVAPDVTLFAYKVFDFEGAGEEADLIAAIERTVDPDQNGDPSDHLDIVNLSGGAFAVDDDPLARAVENATAAGVLFCVAVGNEGGGYGNIATPAIAPSALAVGASELDDTVALFSSRGPSVDFAIKPEIVAPGVGIVSSIPGGGSVAANGTSMATPHVTGVAALLKSLHGDWSPAELKSAIVTASVPLEEDVMVAGAGRVDAMRAAAAGTIVSPTVVSFGQMDHKAAVWSTSRTFTLRNVTSAPQTLTAAVSGTRAGVVIRVTPASVTLASGESATVTADLAVTPGALPVEYHGSLSHGGRITWSGGAVPVHLPWAFVKGGFLIIETPNGGPYTWAVVAGSQGTGQTGFFNLMNRIYWPAETVDVMIVDLTAPYGRPVVFAEDVDIAAGERAVGDLMQAVHRFHLDADDEAGKKLLRKVNRECINDIAFVLRYGNVVWMGEDPFTQYDYVRFGPVSPSVKIHMATRCADAARSSVYMVMHEPQHGLIDSVTRMTRPQWLRQDLRFLPEAEPSQAMTLAVPMMYFGPTQVDEGIWMHQLRDTTSALKLFYTKSLSPEVGAVAMFERYGSCASGSECPLLANMFVYLDGDRVMADRFISSAPSPMAYEVAPGEVLTFGVAPIWPEVDFDAVPGFWGAIARWSGHVGETRLQDLGQVAVYDSAGSLLASAPLRVSREETLPPGRYRTEAINSNYSIAGLPGTATFTGWADTSKAERDARLPMFHGLRILDEHGRASVTMDRDGRASLLFSVADRKADGSSIVPPREDATLVEYRGSGSSDWRPLPALIVARQYPEQGYGSGTTYRVDLTAAVRELAGPVDLRIHVEDDEGNSSELQLEPAFLSGPRVGRRRSVGR